MRPFLILAFVPLLSATPPASAQIAQGRVRLHTLTYNGKFQHAFVADLDGDGARDIFVAHVDTDVAPPRRMLSVFLQTPDGYPNRPQQMWDLHSRAGALFHGDFTEAPGTELGFLAADGAYVYERGEAGYRATPVKLVHHPTFFDTPSPDSVVEWMGRVDVDGNGADDLFVPTARGIRVYLQGARHRFGTVLDLPVAAEHGASAEVVAALDAVPGITTLTTSSAVSLPAVVDVNGDGMSDVLFVQGDRLIYFLQGPQGRFPAAPSDAMQIPLLREFARKDRLEMTFAQVADLNRDRRADLIVSKRHGNLGDFGSIESVFYIFFARPPAPGDAHANRYYVLNAPDQQIRLQGVSPQDPDLGDANGDGYVDILLSQVTTETWSKIVQFGILREISLYYHLFLFDPGRGRYAANAGWSRTLAIPTSNIDSGHASWPYGYIRGDVDGDRRLDFLEISGKRELTVHLGRPVFGILAGAWDFGKDDYFRFELSDGPESVKMEDLNADGRADVILHYDERLVVVLSIKG